MSRHRHDAARRIDSTARSGAGVPGGRWRDRSAAARWPSRLASQCVGGLPRRRRRRPSRRGPGARGMAAARRHPAAAFTASKSPLTDWLRSARDGEAVAQRVAHLPASGSGRLWMAASIGSLASRRNDRGDGGGGLAVAWRRPAAAGPVTIGRRLSVQAGAAQAQVAVAGEQLAVAGAAGGHHAVEHVHRRRPAPSTRSSGCPRPSQVCWVVQ